MEKRQRDRSRIVPSCTRGVLRSLIFFFFFSSGGPSNTKNTLHVLDPESQTVVSTNLTIGDYPFRTRCLYLFKKSS